MSHLGPQPESHTVARIEGPFIVNGMRVWRVYDVRVEVWRKIGPDCLTWDEAVKRAEEFISGKKVIWFGGRKFHRESHNSELAVEFNGDSLK